MSWDFVIVLEALMYLIAASSNAIPIYHFLTELQNDRLGRQYGVVVRDVELFKVSDCKWILFSMVVHSVLSVQMDVLLTKLTSLALFIFTFYGLQEVAMNRINDEIVPNRNNHNVNAMNRLMT